MGVLAQSCVCHGYSTMISNLTSSLSLDTSSKTSSKGALDYIRNGFKERQAEGDVRLSFLENDGVAVNKSSRTIWTKEYYEVRYNAFFLMLKIIIMSN